MYPLFLNLSAKKCLVVGGGKIALRKVIALLRAKAVVTVVATEFCRRFSTVERYVTLQKKKFDESDIDRSITLVISATNNSDVNQIVSRQAGLLNIPCNIVDQPDLCSFIVPAVVRKGNITVAISTGGTAPRLSRYLKTVITSTLGSEMEDFAMYCAEIRKKIRSEISDITVRAQFWESLFATDPIAEIKQSGWNAFKQKTDRLITTYSTQVKQNEK